MLFVWQVQYIESVTADIDYMCCFTELIGDYMCCFTELIGDCHCAAPCVLV